MKVIVGIDPGSRKTGFAVIEVHGSQLKHISHGVIVLEDQKTFVDRLARLGECLQQIFSKYRPDIVVVEKIFMGRNADSAFKLGHARGVAMYEAKRCGADIFEYATRLVKKGIVGKGSADKFAVRSTLETFFQLPHIQHLDASDALALALYHAGRMRSPRPQSSSTHRRKEISI